jgi:predicted HTH transcriptional regulator
MKKLTKLGVQWFYNLLEKGECDILDFKEQLDNKQVFGKSIQNFSRSYEELARDVVAFANNKGGFLFIGIVDGTKEINSNFTYSDERIFELIRQVRDRTVPSVTIQYHKLRVNETDILVLEIPFSEQLHRTSKGEFLIRCNDGNRAIEPYEMATIQSEKGLVIYDQRTWNISLPSTQTDSYGTELPGWVDKERLETLRTLIQEKRPDSPYFKKDAIELLDALAMVKQENDAILPTTTGLLFVGNRQALREIPYSQIKYIHYFEDGTYQPYEYSGNILEIAQQCFTQLKSEIRQKEFHFGLFREYIEDYPEIVIRELLMNAIAHRDYSRQQIIEIRKYPTYIEFESPGGFPQGVDTTNFLRKTNARNPNIMDLLREIGYTEKAGSGFDKIFQALLSKGKDVPKPEETGHSVIFRIKAEVCSEQLIKFSHQYIELTGKEMDMDYLLILNQIIQSKGISFHNLEKAPYISPMKLKHILADLMENEFIEITGKTSGQKYILHISKRHTTKDRINYVMIKKQNKARQKEAIMRYIEDVGRITNSEARQLLKLSQNEISLVSRLFKEMVESNLIEIKGESGGHNRRVYVKKQ